MAEKTAIDYMANYDVCPSCGFIFEESDLSDSERHSGLCKCGGCGKPLILQHVNGLHEIFTSFLDDEPTRQFALTELTIKSMRDWFIRNFCKPDEIGRGQAFVNIVWQCMCKPFADE